MKSNLNALAELATRKIVELAMAIAKRKHRPDGTVYTKPSLEVRKAKNRRINKAAKQARKHNRPTKKRRKR